MKQKGRACWQAGFAPIVIVVLMATLAVGGYLIYKSQIKPNSSPPPQNPVVISQSNQPTPIPSSIPESTSSAETVNWKTYTDPKAGFSFKYPPNIILSLQSKNLIASFKLKVESETIDSINMPQLGSITQEQEKASAEQNRQLLKQEANLIGQGQLPNFADPLDYAMSFNSFHKIGSKYVIDYINTAGYGNTCNVHFDRGLLFFNNNYRVRLIVSPTSINSIVESMPDYFTKDNNTGWCWSNIKYNDPESSFKKAVINNKGSSTAHIWYSTIDQILSTFKFLP